APCPARRRPRRATRSTAAPRSTPTTAAAVVRTATAPETLERTLHLVDARLAVTFALGVVALVARHIHDRGRGILGRTREHAHVALLGGGGGAQGDELGLGLGRQRPPARSRIPPATAAEAHRARLAPGGRGCDTLAAARRDGFGSDVHAWRLE